jgi:hypothetical protein
VFLWFVTDRVEFILLQFTIDLISSHGGGVNTKDENAWYHGMDQTTPYPLQSFGGEIVEPVFVISLHGEFSPPLRMKTTARSLRVEPAMTKRGFHNINTWRFFATTKYEKTMFTKYLVTLHSPHNL